MAKTAIGLFENSGLIEGAVRDLAGQPTVPVARHPARQGVPRRSDNRPSESPYSNASKLLENS